MNKINWPHILPIHRDDQFWDSQVKMHGDDIKAAGEVLRFRAALFYYEPIRTNKLIEMWHQTRGKAEHQDIGNVLTYRLIHQTDLGLDK